MEGQSMCTYITVRSTSGRNKNADIIECRKRQMIGQRKEKSKGENKS